MRWVGVVAAVVAIGCGSDGSGGAPPSGERDAGPGAHVTVPEERHDAAREPSPVGEASPPSEVDAEAPRKPRDAAPESSVAPDGSDVVPGDAGPGEAGAGGATGSGGASSTGGAQTASGGAGVCVKAPFEQACAGHTCEYVPTGCKSNYYCAPPENPKTKCVSALWDCQVFKDSCGGEFQCQPVDPAFMCDGSTIVPKP